AVKRCRRSRKTRCQHVQEGGDVQMAQRMKVTYELKECCKSVVKVMYELKERCNSVVRKNNPFMQA
ncbi:hypothetical protein, partial [Citrobacter freundii]|uniref:hypothetical protein n=1 Tax=Citrobacter freundii TaxID=546 RepID=UPI00397B7C8F